MSEKHLFPYEKALEVANDVCDTIKDSVDEYCICGGIRRKKQFVHDIDIVALIKDETQIFFLNSLIGAHYNTTATERKVVFNLLCDLNKITCEIYICQSYDEYEILKLIRTGSEKFNEELIRRAQGKGLAVRFAKGKYGLFGAVKDTNEYTGEVKWVINPARVYHKENDIIMKVFNDEALLDPVNRNWQFE